MRYKGISDDFSDEPRRTLENGVNVRLHGAMKLQDKLLHLMDIRRKHQAVLVRETGIGQTAMSEVCAGKRRLKLDEALRMAKALDVTLDFLADESRSEPDTDRLKSDELRVLEWYRTLKDRIGESEAMLIVASAVKGPSLGEAILRHKVEPLPAPKDKPEAKPRRSGKR